jgi:hypothetical protein
MFIEIYSFSCKLPSDLMFTTSLAVQSHPFTCPYYPTLRELSLAHNTLINYPLNINSQSPRKAAEEEMWTGSPTRLSRQKLIS